jgi:hypothetical protein
VHLAHIYHTRNMCRFYRLDVQPDLQWVPLNVS